MPNLQFQQPFVEDPIRSRCIPDGPRRRTWLDVFILVIMTGNRSGVSQRRGELCET